MLENPFYNPNQIDSGQLKAIEAKLKSDLQSFVSSEISKLQQSLSNQQGAAKSTKKELIETSQQPADLSGIQSNQPQLQFNYTTDANYNGQDVKFVLAGQVLTPEEAGEFGDINYIDLGGGGGGGSNPFKINSKIIAVSETENVYQVTINAGSINSLLPTGILSGGGLNVFTINENSLNFVILRAQSDGAQIVSANVFLSQTSAGSQTPTIFGLPTQIEFLIGAVYNTSVYQVLNNNINVSGVESFVTEKPTPAQAGELPFDIYYVWG
jgi:hypothetical protein